MFEGEWGAGGGKVIPFRWLDEENKPPCNVVNEVPTWVADAAFFVSTDYGYNDPAVALFWAVGADGRKLILSEIYESGLEPAEFVRRIEKRTRDLDIEVQHYIGDPQQPFVTDLLRKHGLPIFDRKKPGELRDRAAGFEMLRDELSVDPAVNEPRLKVHVSCENTIREWKNIRFKDNTNKEFGDGAIVGHDHALDAARYFLMSRPKPREKERDWLVDFERNQREAARWRKHARRGQSPLIGVNPSVFVEAY